MKFTDTANFKTVLHNPYLEVALGDTRKVDVAFVHLVASDIHFGERCSKTVAHLRSLLDWLHRLHRLHWHRLLLRVVITRRGNRLRLLSVLRILVILCLRWRNRLLRLLRQRLCNHLGWSNSLYLIDRRLLVIVVLCHWALLAWHWTLRLLAIDLAGDDTESVPVGHFGHFLNLSCRFVV